ncbi:MAG TPA: selenoneine synthase SenA [Gemmataceae bacterium]|jgi:iron(II)-dependent oxidoreductase
MFANANLLRLTPALLAEWVRDARQRTLDLIVDLRDEQLLGPRLPLVNPLLWEIGHLAWFAERWILRHAGQQPPLRADGDALYDSSAVPHATRWDLPLPSRTATLDYMRQVQERVLDVLDRGPNHQERYFILLAIFHEDMHGEAFLYSRQTLAYPRPSLTAPTGGSAQPTGLEGGDWPGDVLVPGGSFALGAMPDEPFVFDNEKWAHLVPLRPFAIARAPVTQSEFAAFVEADGYRRPELWSKAGWHWRQTAEAEQPLYWQRQRHGWLRRDFDRWVPLESHKPVLHVNWYEAEAYCRWAGRRLPTEAEWEVAASTSGPDLAGPKRRFPWGETPPDATCAQLDGYALGCCDVATLPEGDSAWGCRQMIGNVWEWTADDFGPYPGFTPDPYRDYSQPWFATHKVLRGGAWMTRSRMLRNTWRNFYKPDRRDVWAGFRTCALQP